MELSKLYAGKLREALRGSVDTRKVAEAWAALHPAGFKDQRGASKALPPDLAAFLGGFADAISRALRKVLGSLWPESWVLGQQAAEALASATDVDWAGWTPGDVEAAFQVAGTGLRDLLASQDVTIQSITGSRLEELGDVLAQYISSDAIGRVPVSEGPLEPEYSIGALADALEGVLDNPERAYMVAQTEVARASSIAAQEVFRSMGVGQVQVSSAGDTRVCPRCASAEAAGAQPLGTYSVPLHPMCRCALIPVIPVGQALAALGGLVGAS